jgi:hypothetical protein
MARQVGGGEVEVGGRGDREEFWFFIEEVDSFILS